jgi:AcrR family transcriptional regulator
VSTSTLRRRAVSAEEKSQRRDEILAAAKEVFAHKGFHATTIGDIAKRAGLAYGLVYWYFDSKDELFHALMAVEEEALRAHIAAALAATGGPPRGGGEKHRFGPCCRPRCRPRSSSSKSTGPRSDCCSATPTRSVTASKSTSAGSASDSSTTSKPSPSAGVYEFRLILKSPDAS